MVSRQKDQTLDWSEEVERLPGPEGEGAQRNDLRRSDFTGGFGTMRDDGTAEARRSLFFSRVVNRTGRDAVGGGGDPRWGGLMGGPRVRGPVALTGLSGFDGTDGAEVRKLVAMVAGGATHYLAAVGRNLIGTTDPTNWAAATVHHTFTDPIIDLKVYGSRKGGPELNIALDGGPRVVTYDLATYYEDGYSFTSGAVDKRKVVPQAFYVWRAADGQYYDLTASVTDDNPETGTGAYLDSFPAADYVLIGFRHVFEAIDWQMGSHANGGGGAPTQVAYWNGTAWATTAFSGFTDGTVSGSSVLQHNGTMSWVYSGSGWLPTVLTSQYQSEPLYFVKVQFSATFTDPSVQVQEVKVRYQLAPQAYAVSGTNLVMIVDNATLITTPAGGTDGVVYDTTGPFAIPASAGGAFSASSGTVIAAENLAGTVYALKDNGVFSVTAGGVPTELAPHMAEQPSVETTQGHTVWNNHLYLAHDWELLEIGPEGGVQSIGPERLTFGASTVQFRATALEGHGIHFLYGAFMGSDGNSYLGAWGIYRHVVDTTTQIESWQRMDTWALVGDLGGRRITAMRVMFDATHQPWLLLGDAFGNILRANLPRGFHPLDPHSGYEWSDAEAEAVWPEYDGFDATRAVVAYRCTFRGRNLDATHYVELATKPGAVDTTTIPWVTRCAANDPDDDDFDDLLFASDHVGYGLNVRLTFRRPAGSFAAAGAILDTFAPWYRQPLRGTQRKWTLNVQAHDRVLTLQRRRVPRTTAGWEALVRRWASPATADRQRFTLVTPTGEARVVMVDGVKESVGRPNPQGPPLLAYAIACSSAE